MAAERPTAERMAEIRERDRTAIVATSSTAWHDRRALLAEIDALTAERDESYAIAHKHMGKSAALRKERDDLQVERNLLRSRLAELENAARDVCSENYKTGIERLRALLGRGSDVR